MLPPTYFDRLTQAMGIRTERRGGERRKATRIPATFRPEAYPLLGDVLLTPQPVRCRDVSTGGVGLVATGELVKNPLLLIRVKQKRLAEAFVMLCQVRRIVRVDGACALLGCSFEKVLYPGQTVGAGVKITSLLWVDVSGDVVAEDPMLDEREAA